MEKIKHINSSSPLSRLGSSPLRHGTSPPSYSHSNQRNQLPLNGDGSPRIYFKPSPSPQDQKQLPKTPQEYIRSRSASQSTDNDDPKEDVPESAGYSSEQEFISRWGPMVALFLTTGISAAVWMLQLGRAEKFSNLVDLVTTGRTTVQVIIQVMAHILGALWIWAICKTMKSYARSRLQRHGIAMQDLRFWSTLCSATVNWNLAFLPSVVMLLFLALTFVPATIWVGALTPQLTTYVRNESLAVTHTGPGSYSFLHPSLMGPTFGIYCWSTVQYNGTFSNCPVWTFPGHIIETASSASSADGTPTNRTKFDNTKFRYQGRSYGVGVAPGLTDAAWLDESVVSYDYLETGYLTSARCIYNESSRWTLETLEIDDYLSSQFLPSIVRASGWFPNSNWTEVYLEKFAEDQGIWSFFSQFSNGGTDDVVAIGSTNSDHVEDYYIAIAAGKGYDRLDKVQCQIYFTPTVFNVSVSNSEATITVTPLNDTAVDPEPRGILRANVLRNLNDMSQIVTSMYISIIGSALMSNVQNLLDPDSSQTALSIENASNETILAGVTDSILAMTDDILSCLNAAALTLPNSTITTTASAHVDTIRLGNSQYIIATFALNAAALFLVTGLTVYSGFWAGLDAFDFTDLGCLTVGTLVGNIAPEYAKKVRAGGLRDWNGDPRHSLIGQTTLRLEPAEGSRYARLVLG